MLPGDKVGAFLAPKGVMSIKQCRRKGLFALSSMWLRQVLNFRRNHMLDKASNQRRGLTRQSFDKILLFTCQVNEFLRDGWLSLISR